MARTIKLRSSRFGRMVEHFYDSIEDAALSAVEDVGSNESCPMEIIDGETVVWETDGIFGDSMDKLRELANWEEDF